MVYLFKGLPGHKCSVPESNCRKRSIVIYSRCYHPRSLDGGVQGQKWCRAFWPFPSFLTPCDPFLTFWLPLLQKISSIFRTLPLPPLMMRAEESGSSWEESCSSQAVSLLSGRLSSVGESPNRLKQNIFWYIRSWVQCAITAERCFSLPYLPPPLLPLPLHSLSPSIALLLT